MLILAAGFAACAGGAACLAAQTGEAADDPVLAMIRAQTARLILTHRTVETIPGKAEALQIAILHDDFTQAHAIAGAVLADSHLTAWHFLPFDTFLGLVARNDNPDFRHKLDGWCDSARDDPLPFLVRARYEIDLGWWRRQNRRLVESRNLMREGARDIATVQRLNDTIPTSYTLKQIIYPDTNDASEALQGPFDDAIAKFPDYLRAYEERLWSLLPSTGGSVKAMYTFVDESAAKAPDGSPKKLLYLRLYCGLLWTAADKCNRAGTNTDDAKTCVVGEMKNMTLPSLESGVQTALNLYHTVDKSDFIGALRPTLLDMTAIRNANVNAGAVLQLAAAAMDSDNAISRDDGQHGNYMLDMLTGDVWVRGGFPDNADVKYHHALDDVAANEFPNEEERDLAMAEIYDRLANLAMQSSHFTDVIAFMDAAYAYSGARGNLPPYSKCRAYYELKLYRAGADACSELIDRGGGYGELYWRGKLNVALKRDDDAIRDFTALAANLTDSWATDSVIQMSLILGNHKDFQGMLDMFFKYPYAFKECCESRAQLAVTFNNRCYAYMNLGELEKALDDCTTSLRYGSLPDAFRKQQELVKRLKDKEKPGTEGPT